MKLIKCIVLALIPILGYTQSKNYYDYKDAFEDRDSVTSIYIQCAYCNIHRSDGCNSVPDSIYLLKNLEAINIQETRVKYLPTSINQLHRLKAVYLQGNRWMNYQEELCKLVGLDSLVHLGLWLNDFRKLPQCITNIKTLESIDLGQNSSFLLSENLAVLKAFPKLKSIRLTHYEKSFPYSFRKLKNIQSVDLSYSKKANISHVINVLSSMQIEELDLSSRSSSTLPSNISKLTNLKTIRLNSNWFYKLPTRLSKIHSLEEIYCASNNAHKFEIDASITQLKHLKKLDISSSNLTNAKESLLYLSQLDSLEMLNLSRCDLKNEIETFGAFKNLKTLEIRSTAGVDIENLFVVLGNLKTLKELFIGFHSLSLLPKEIKFLTQLEFLDLGGNKNITELPKEIYGLKNLKQLNLYDIKLSASQLKELQQKLPLCKITYELYPYTN